MNLLLLAVWCGLFTCTISLPRRRQVKYPVTKHQNLYNERSHPTALEVLEKHLLRPGERKWKRSIPHPGRKRKCRNSSEESTPGGEVSNNKGEGIAPCIASFGDQSPLCKPRRRQKKSFVGIPDIHKRLFRSDTGFTQNMTVTSPSTLEDFFGIFSSSDAPTIDKDISKFDVSPLAATEYGIQTNTTVSSIQSSKVTLRERYTPVSIQTTTTPKTTYHPTNMNVTDKGSTVDSAKQEASKIILPGSVQKIETQPQLLYIEEDDNPKSVSRDGSYIKAVEESEGDSVTADGGSVSPTTEQATETSSVPGLTLPHLQKSVLQGATYSKTDCEREKKTKCICSFSSVDSDFQTIFSKAKNEAEIMVEVANMKCRRYSPEPAVFDLNTNAKPRVLKGKHAPFAVDNRQGAKEVTEKSLDEFILYSTLDDGITRVFVSSDVKIPCFPQPDIHLSATDADHVQYTWTYGSKRQAITKGRITDDSDGDGSLTIEDIELTDSMNYTCEIDYIHPDTGERTVDTFVHSLSVVTLPIVSARAMVHYKSSAACDQSLLEMFEMYLPQVVEKTVCTPGDHRRPQLCSVVVHSPVCHSEGKSKREIHESQASLNREKREKGSMEMSLNYDVFIHRTGAKALPAAAAKTTVCDPDCHLLLNFKLLQILRESVQEVARIPIISKVQGGGEFTPVPSSVKVKYIFGCIGGYYLDNGFCLACPKGMYSDDGATECQHCPLHTYSTTVGARKCTPCKYLWMPICNEYFESINMMMIVIVIGLVVLLLISFIVYYVLFYKGQNWRDILKKGPKAKIAKSERIRSRKEAKQARNDLKEELKVLRKEAIKSAKTKQEEEMELLLQSSGASETESEPELKKKENPVKFQY